MVSLLRSSQRIVFSRGEAYHSVSDSFYSGRLPATNAAAVPCQYPDSLSRRHHPTWGWTA